MTDDITTTASDMNDDDLFEGAQDTFPSKFDLRDRLVVIYPTGVHGTRQSESTGKSYEWYETTTVVLDDGPDGWQAQVPGDGGELQDNLVPSVADNGAQVLTNFQWSAGAFTSRIKTKLPVGDGKPGSVLGRVNVIKNSKKGMAPPWSISKPTEADMETARRYRDVCAAARQAIVEARRDAADEAAF